MTSKASLLGPAEADEACWRDDEIKLGEEEGWKAAADSCHMLLSRAAIGPWQDLSLPVQKGRHLRSGEQRSEPQGHLNTDILASWRSPEMPPTLMEVPLSLVKHASVSPAKGEFSHF